MKSIEESQSKSIHDTCTHCGSFVDIGAVIEADDTHLVLNLLGADALTKAKALADKAVSRFANATFDIKETTDGVELSLNFTVSAEKMIFQLQNSL